MPTNINDPSIAQLFEGRAVGVDDQGQFKTHFLETIVAKTADYSVVAADLGKTFTNRGATAAVNFTLPDTSTIDAGWWVDFFVVANYSVTVTAATADTMVAHNDANADSVAFSTTSKMIGGGFRVTWDGTGWLVRGFLGSDAQVITVAT